SATLRAVLYLAVPAAVGLIVLSELLVRVIFERGAFTSTSTAMVSWALAFFALGLPAHAVVEIVVRAFYAMHDTKTPVAIGVGAMALNVVLSLAFIALFKSLGWIALGGLALSNSLATTIEMVVLLTILRGRLDGLDGRRMASSLMRICAAALLMGLVAAVCAWALEAFPAILAAVVAVGTGGLMYVSLSLALGSPEPRAVWAVVRSGRRP
ncbi:lipid II flippase MurJ, partial [Chloroflexota bacterium]